MCIFCTLARLFDERKFEDGLSAVQIRRNDESIPIHKYGQISKTNVQSDVQIHHKRYKTSNDNVGCCSWNYHHHSNSAILGPLHRVGSPGICRYWHNLLSSAYVKKNAPSRSVFLETVSRSALSLQARIGDSLR